MKIALIRLNSPADEIIPPISLGILAQLLRKQHHVAVFDCLLSNLDYADLQTIGRNFDIAGITLFTKDIAICMEYLKILKNINPSIVTILGGPHPSAVPVETLDFFGSLCDFVIAGEAEISIVKLLDALAHGRPDMPAIGGLCYRGSDRIFINKPIYPEQLDNYTVAWDLMPPSSYPPAPHGAFFRHYPAAPIITSRGCPYGCLFCAGHKVTGRNIRRRSIENVIEEVKLLRDCYGVHEIHIEDDNFTADKEYVMEFCRQAKAHLPGLSWACPNGVRIDTIDTEMLAAMKAAGFYALSFGIESGNDDILESMGKKLTVADLRQKIELVHRSGIETIGFFILGFPGESRSQIEKTIQLAVSLPLTRASFATFQPFPGSVIFDKLLRAGSLHIENWEKFTPNLQTTIWSPEGLSIDELSALRRKALLRFYLRVSTIKALILNIQGIHHVYFIIKRAIRWLFTKRKTNN
jgi:radical SAM superfamily enzyme YgiQ (UPF0313 family)